MSFTETGVTVCCQMPEDKLSKPLHENLPKYVVESTNLRYLEQKLRIYKIVFVFLIIAYQFLFITFVYIYV